MDDKDILGHIGALVERERALRDRAAGQGLSAEEQRSLADLESGLDQSWDLLRQRRARSEFGADPDGASARPPQEVESYES